MDRIVLDTNVCLDLFVFGDPRCGRLRKALDDGAVQALTDTACRDEWRRVLGYAQLALDEARQRAALADFDACMQFLDGAATAASLPALPRCRDPHDQKFLELAWRGRARWLLSRDEHLLSLAGRMARVAGVSVLAPADW